jgi:hypothetical protein
VADAQTVIQRLGLQVGQLTVDKAILEAELAEARAQIAALQAGGAPAGELVCLGELEAMPALEDKPPQAAAKV